LAGAEHPEREPAGVAGERDPGFDRPLAACSEFAVALGERVAVLDSPQAMPINASRCSGSPVRRIPPRRVVVLDW